MTSAEKNTGEENELFSNPSDVVNYIDSVRYLYRAGHGEYRGQRNEDQKMIAEIYGEEADNFIDTITTNTLELLNPNEPAILPETTKLGKLTWAEYRASFRQLVVGFGIITNRLVREGKLHEPELQDLPQEDSTKVISQLFTDFQELNALRFGVSGSNIVRPRWRKNPKNHGKVERMPVDIDLATDDTEMTKLASERTYNEESAIHTAGKMSAAEYITLRQFYNEVEKKKFDDIAGFAIDAAEKLEKLNR